MMVTSTKLSIRLKAAGAVQEGQLQYAIGPEDMPEEKKEKVSGFILEYLFKKIPMALTVKGKKMVFDFCRFQVDNEFVFAVSYRPIEATLATRKNLIPGSAQSPIFTEAMGELYFWLLTQTTAFGQPKKKAKQELPAEQPQDDDEAPAAGDEEKPKKESGPVFKAVEEVAGDETPPVEEEPKDNEIDTNSKTNTNITGEAIDEN